MWMWNFVYVALMFLIWIIRRGCQIKSAVDYMLVLCIIVFGAKGGYDYQEYRHQPIKNTPAPPMRYDYTDNYYLPPEIKGCRVIIIDPKDPRGIPITTLLCPAPLQVVASMHALRPVTVGHGTQPQSTVVVTTPLMHETCVVGQPGCLPMQ